jgi:hypothetical protein
LGPERDGEKFGHPERDSGCGDARQ